jgi:amino acid permease
MTLGVSVFNVPNKFASLGLIQGIVYFALAVLLTYYTFNIIFEASEFTKKNSFSEIVQSLLGK